MYQPIVHSGTRLIGPASEKTNGSEEITLLPKEDFTHRTTPKVIRYNEIRSRKCCQRNDIAFSLFVITDNISNFLCIDVFRGNKDTENSIKWSGHCCRIFRQCE